MNTKKYLIIGSAMTLLLAGCTPENSNSTSASTSKESTTTHTDFKSENSVKLCDYKNLKIERYVDEITDDVLQEYMDEEYAEVGEYEEVDRAAKEKDNVEVAMKLTSGDETLEEYLEDDYTSVIIGDGMYGDEFDKQMVGIKAGETRNFQVTFPSDAYEFANMTVDFTVKALSVQEFKLPEQNEAFYMENFEVRSEEEFKEKCRKEMTEEYELYSDEELEENLLLKVVELSTDYTYTKELYEEAKAEVDEEYMAFAEEYMEGSIEDLKKEFGITDADIEEEVMIRIKSKLVQDAIVEKENIQISDEDYDEYAKKLSDYYGYESVDEFKQLYEEEIIRENIKQVKVIEVLKENATITDVPRPEEEDN